MGCEYVCVCSVHGNNCRAVLAVHVYLGIQFMAIFPFGFYDHTDHLLDGQIEYKSEMKAIDLVAQLFLLLRMGNHVLQYI